MWKSLLDALIESFVAIEPTVYMYWLVAKREAEEQAAAIEQPEPRHDHVARIDFARGRKEATA
jgi:hypothetical protein